MSETASTGKAPARRRTTGTAPAANVSKAAAAKANVSKPTTAATAKPATAAKVAQPKAEVTADTVTKFGVTLEPAPATKNYAKFVPPVGSGCTGTLYVPLGATEVKILVVGAAAPTA